MDYNKEHSIELKDRKSIRITAVKHVDSYDDKEIILVTSMGNLVLKGSDLNIKSLNLDDGTLLVTGLFDNLFYAEDVGAKRKNLIKRILK